MIVRVDPLISIREAETRILSSCGALGSESVDLGEAAGRVLAEPLVADRALPPFPRSMMDGVAFCRAQTAVGIPLKIAGLHAAGDPPPRRLVVGEAWEIMTGAAVPDDCDAVVPYEDLAAGFTLAAPAAPGQCIHPCGLDARPGDVLVAPGARLGPAEIAIAASIGRTRLNVRRRPRVILITTGDETVPVESTPEPWQIRRSNGPLLESCLRSIGCESLRSHHVPDDAAVVEQVTRQALAECDVLLLCGGISMGKKDHVRRVLEASLGAPAFHGVSLRPGKPLAYWPGPPQVFALPGNPVSVLATFTRFVVPALREIQGQSAPAPLRMPVANVTPAGRFSWLLPVAGDAAGRLVARPPRNSGDYVSLAGAIGIVEIPPQADFTAGQSFPFHPFF